MYKQNITMKTPAQSLWLLNKLQREKKECYKILLTPVLTCWGSSSVS